jgi:hypothetical protein
MNSFRQWQSVHPYFAAQRNEIPCISNPYFGNPVDTLSWRNGNPVERQRGDFLRNTDPGGGVVGRVTSL